jgi:hypothetical protein
MKKRQHFIPQFYLRRFATYKPKEEIWTYDIENGLTRGSTINNTAFEKYLYSVTLEDGKRLDDLENLISVIEGKAAPVLEKLINGEKVDDHERADFASFIAIMHVRTDAFRHQFAQTMVAGLQVVNYATAIHDEAFKNSMEKYQREKGPLSTEEIESLRKGMLNPQNFVVSVDKEWTLQALSFHDGLAPILYEMHWSTLIAGAPRYFITSDNPVIFEVPNQHRHHFYGGGLTHKKVELTFPLSSHTCLLATWNKTLPTRLEVNAETTKTLNRYRAIYARRFLFGPRRDTGIEKLGAKFKNVTPGMKISGFGPDGYSPVKLRRSGR